MRYINKEKRAIRKGIITRVLKNSFTVGHKTFKAYDYNHKHIISQLKTKDTIEVYYHKNKPFWNITDVERQGQNIYKMELKCDKCGKKDCNHESLTRLEAFWYLGWTFAITFGLWVILL